MPILNDGSLFIKGSGTKERRVIRKFFLPIFLQYSKIQYTTTHKGSKGIFFDLDHKS